MVNTLSRKALQKNYSRVGTALIERLYGDNFLSLSGEKSSDHMITLSGINANSQVLDVGSGVGGPALYLAEKTGCRVTGVDIIEWNVEEANKRSSLRGLAHKVGFQVGDATALSFADAYFDVVLSQDAWCHVVDKRRVVAEAVRTLRPGGYVAFTDWVELAWMDPEYAAEVRLAVAAPNFATPAAYAGWLVDEGCTVISQIDISQRFDARYQTMISNLKLMEAEITERFSKDVFAILLKKNKLILNAFEDGKLGGIELVAQKES
ncbi:MAG: methyltransferase domain-containing protein [Pseudomonadota bacterium]|nr:methyltransferase domain-containing protein [Pseudomonadota bacterium]